MQPRTGGPSARVGLDPPVSYLIPDQALGSRRHAKPAPQALGPEKLGEHGQIADVRRPVLLVWNVAVTGSYPGRITWLFALDVGLT